MTAAAVLLALGAASCGDEDGSETASNPAAQSREGEAAPPQSSEGDDSGSAQSGGSAGGNGSSRRNADGEDSSSAGFTPKPHEDSGGGSEQFRVPDGDNSVQEFGAEGEDDELDAAAAALHGFFDARAQKAWAAACSYLASDLATSLEETAAQIEKGAGESCARGLELSTNTAAMKQLRKEARQVDVGSLRAEDDTGFILYRDGEGTVYAIAMAKEGGEWKVVALAGLPLS